METSQCIVLGLGSNVGDRIGLLRAAVQLLAPLLESMRCSSLYESPALLPEGAPPEWDVAYYNMAVCGFSSLAPRAWLAEAKHIERELGRKARGHWGPREIDVDILAYGETVISQADLAIPHAGLLQRDFALLPFAELLPDWRYPVAGECFGRTAGELSSRFLPLPRLEVCID